MSVTSTTTKILEETGNPWPVVGVLAVLLGLISWGVIRASKHWDDEDHH